METGYDIIFFWVARMIMLGLHLTDTEPFHTVYLSGPHPRPATARRCRKTKGNVVDPLGVIDETGADALRFAVIHGAAPGQDQRFGPAKLENARNFANKLWNATRFVVGRRPSTIPADAERRLPDERHLGPAERWIRSRAAATVVEVDAAIADFTFGEVTRSLYDAIWNEFCDWGLELAKARLADDSLPDEVSGGDLVDPGRGAGHVPAAAPPGHAVRDRGALGALATSCLATRTCSSWPAGRPPPSAIRSSSARSRHASTSSGDCAMRAPRRASSRAPGCTTEVVVPQAMGATFEALRPGLEVMARARPLRPSAGPRARSRPTQGPSRSSPGISRRSSCRSRILRRTMARPRDRARLEKELAEAEAWLVAARERLANEAFTSKAPPAVVEGARARESELADQVERLRERLARLRPDRGRILGPRVPAALLRWRPS